jgi:hypothetical protein
MKPLIEVLHRQVYGRDQFEPLNEEAKVWALRFKTKTLTRDALRSLEIKGYEVLIKQKEVKL